MSDKGVYFTKLITKDLTATDSQRRFFEGLLTVEMVDKQNEVTIVDELMKALPIWMSRGAPISDTHSNRIVGKGISFQKTTVDDGDSVYPAILIQGEIYKDYELDHDIWDKIKSGEYKGLSFGGATRSDRKPVKNKDGTISYSLWDLEHYEVAVCFLAGTKILMADESKKNIEDIKTGDMVIGHDGKPHRVSKRMKRKYNGWIHEVNTGNTKKDKRRKSYNPLFVTPEHPIMMKDGTFKAVRELKKGDSVRTAHVVWNKNKHGYLDSDKPRYETKLDSYNKNKEIERIEKERDEFEKQGFKFIRISGHNIPDAVAVKDDKVLAVEVEYKGRPNFEKYLTVKHDYDDIVWIRRGKNAFKNSIKLGTAKIRSTGKKSGFYHKGYVYNLEVDDVHTYVANGIIVHNCEDPAVPLALITEYNNLAKANIKDGIDRGNGQICIKCDRNRCYVDKWNDTKYADKDPSRIDNEPEGEQWSNVRGPNVPRVQENPPAFKTNKPSVQSKKPEKITAGNQQDPLGQDPTIHSTGIGASSMGGSPGYGQYAKNDDEEDKEKTINTGEDLVSNKPVQGLRHERGDDSGISPSTMEKYDYDMTGIVEDKEHDPRNKGGVNGPSIEANNSEDGINGKMRVGNDPEAGAFSTKDNPIGEIGIKGSYDTYEQDTGDSRQVSNRKVNSRDHTHGRDTVQTSRGHKDDGYSLGKSEEIELIKLKSRILSLSI